MQDDREAIITILEKLVSYPSISLTPNIELMYYIRDYLLDLGVNSSFTYSDDKTRANLYATIGPLDRPGVMLSGHVDVVPVEGQNWSSDPFKLRRSNAKLYGRGTADMKGFVANALHIATHAARTDLQTPLHLAISYDEEIGCIGVRRLIDQLKEERIKPQIIIVGEPTSLQVATGHKGKLTLKVDCYGLESHSALAPQGMNAIHMAGDLIQAIRLEQEQLEQNGIRDEFYELPYATLNVARIEAGTAVNIVPNHCRFYFDIRHPREEDPYQILDRIKGKAEVIVKDAQIKTQDARIDFEILNVNPGLNTALDSKAVELARSLSGANSTMKVNFGTEGGPFAKELEIETVICGPGSMDQGHKADEFVEEDQLMGCHQMLENLILRLEKGL